MNETQVSKLNDYLMDVLELEKEKYVFDITIEDIYAQANRLAIPKVINKPRQDKPIYIKSYKSSFIECGVLLALASIFFSISNIIGLILVISAIGTVYSTARNNSREYDRVNEFNDIINQKYNKEIDKENSRLEKEQLERKELTDSIVPFKEALKTINEYLHNLYEYGAIYEKYRNIYAIGCMSEYISSGRCNSLTGHDGAYNLYENELRLNSIIGGIEKIGSNIEIMSKEMSEKMDVIIRSHERLNYSINEANNQIVSLSSEMETANRIGTYNAVMNTVTAHNTRVIAKSTKTISKYLND